MGGKRVVQPGDARGPQQMELRNEVHDGFGPKLGAQFPQRPGAHRGVLGKRMQRHGYIMEREAHDRTPNMLKERSSIKPLFLRILCGDIVRVWMKT